ncbi:hypothetical protein SLE2022_181690 [Rubroshorea leprosula]
MLFATDLLSFPLSPTLSVPSDNSLSNLPTSSTSTIAAAMDPFIIPYYIVLHCLAFSDLRLNYTIYGTDTYFLPPPPLLSTPSSPPTNPIELPPRLLAQLGK